MAKRLLVLILIVTGLALALQAADKPATQRELVYLQNGSDLRISIETGRAKEGWAPVAISVAGAQITAAMDEKGRVVQSRAKGSDKRGLALFTIELEKNRILLGRESHAIVIYEQNLVRTRIRLVAGVIPLPVRMDQTGKNGKLRFGGLEITAQIGEADRFAASRAVRPAGAKPGSAAVRPAGFTAAPPAARGFGAKAQLSPSRIKARAK